MGKHTGAWRSAGRVTGIVVGAGMAIAGSASVALAQPAGAFPAIVDLQALDAATGYVIAGANSGDQLGQRVAIAGDLNHDGLADILLSSSNATRPGASSVGIAHVVMGRAYDGGSLVDVDTLTGPDGFFMRGAVAGDAFGSSVSGAGDLNHDGVDDFVIGAIAADPNGNQSAGRAYAIFGRAQGFGATLSIQFLDPGEGFIVNGPSPFTQNGRAVTAAGDVNGDGIDDLLVAGPSADLLGRSNAGEAYVVYGSGSGFPFEIASSQLNGGSLGFNIPGPDAGDNLGIGLSGRGDFNGDGVDDFLVGVPGGDPPGTFGAGEAYVVFGQAGNFPGNFNIAGVNGATGVRLDGFDGQTGTAVSFVGDVNGDGVDDVAITAPREDNSRGRTYIVFGSDSGLPAVITLRTLNGTNGFAVRGIGTNDESGVSVTGAGDLNHDGYDEVAIGAWFADPDGRNDAGEVYVVFGGPGPFPTLIEASALDGTDGFRGWGVQSLDLTGESVSGGADLSGDGIDDLVIGARRLDGPSGETGGAYVLFGRAADPGCPGDRDDDDATTIFDIIDFLNAWSVMDPTADLDDDGEWTILDILDYLGVWDAGCP